MYLSIISLLLSLLCSSIVASSGMCIVFFYSSHNYKYMYNVHVKPYTTAQPSILTPPVDATVCLNSIAEFTCSTDGQALEWRLNGTGADAFSELQIINNYLNPGTEATLLVPGIHKFKNTGITCTGGTFGVGSSTSDPVQLFVQGCLACM